MLDGVNSSVIVAYNTEHPKQDTTMTRKLHNTLMAAIASSSLLVVGIIASSPITPYQGANKNNTASVLASIDSQAVMASDAIDQADAAPIQRARAVRHSRQSLAMPFFSFAPRS
jgi:Neuraminidase (sialidase)